MLRDRPKRVEKPYIYHLDVGAMYPNIILTNRLQPSAIVDNATCAACDFNQAKNDCKRRMDWVWRGDYNPATKNEYDRTKDQLSRETVHGQPLHALPQNEQEVLVASRLKTYSRNAYKKTKIRSEETRTDRLWESKLLTHYAVVCHQTLPITNTVSNFLLSLSKFLLLFFPHLHSVKH